MHGSFGPQITGLVSRVYDVLRGKAPLDPAAAAALEAAFISLISILISWESWPVSVRPVEAAAIQRAKYTLAYIFCYSQVRADCPPMLMLALVVAC